MMQFNVNQLATQTAKAATTLFSRNNKSKKSVAFERKISRTDDNIGRQTPRLDAFERRRSQIDEEIEITLKFKTNSTDNDSLNVLFFFGKSLPQRRNPNKINIRETGERDAGLIQ